MEIELEFWVASMYHVCTNCKLTVINYINFVRVVIITVYFSILNFNYCLKLVPTSKQFNFYELKLMNNRWNICKK